MIDEQRREGFFERVYDMVRQIPQGRVASYGQIASLIGAPRCSRQVGFALHANPYPGIVPCHRVVFADGRICEGCAFGGAEAQRSLLETEGVIFRDDLHVDLTRSRWEVGL